MFLSLISSQFNDWISVEDIKFPIAAYFSHKLLQAISVFLHHHQTPHNLFTQRLDLAEAVIDGEVCLGFGVGGAVGGGVVAGAVQADQLVVEEEAVFAGLRGDGRALVSLCHGDIEPVDLTVIYSGQAGVEHLTVDGRPLRQLVRGGHYLELRVTDGLAMQIIDLEDDHVGAGTRLTLPFLHDMRQAPLGGRP